MPETTRETKTDLPRILFVNDFPPDSLALADLTRQLLLGYPADRIAWWYSRWSRVRGLKDLPVGSLNRWPMPDKLVPGQRFNSLKGALLEWVWTPMAARHLRRTVARVRPDVVWVLLFGWPIFVAHRGLPRHGPRLHVSLWDYPDTVAARRAIGDARARRFLNAIYQLVRRANSWDGISPAVLEEVASATGRADGVMVHSGFEPHHLERLEHLAAPPRDPVLRLAYVGTIISEKSFREMLTALDQVRGALGRPVMLEFYGARGYQKAPWFNPQWMHEHGVFSDQELVVSVQRCDWGIVVMDLDGEDLRYSKFSFPNKIGTYLSAGVPVLGLGHPESSLGRIMRDHPLGRFTASPQREDLVRFLRETLAVDEPRAVFRDTILRCARTEFDATAIRRRLWGAWQTKQA
jgi:hypothetical protein